MITLATLPQASAQEVFGQVAKHLLTQGGRSTATDVGEFCAYRGDDGCKCAAGCLIGDEEYDPSWERVSWFILARTGRVPKKHSYLVHRLQRIHDKMPPSEWRYALSRLAEEERLSSNALRGDYAV